MFDLVLRCRKGAGMDITERLRAEIAARADDVAALTADLVRIPTLNPPGENYREVCSFVAARLRSSGFDCQLIRAEGARGDSDGYPRWNIVARRENGTGPCVHFNSHHDVVEVGHGWTKDPFGGEISEGKVWGRGSCDMKGGLAASIVAVEAFLAVVPDWRGAIEISATADEETGGYGGVAYLAEKDHFERVNHVIIPEPLNKDRICLGHRGVWWAEVETKGRIGHGSMPFLGDCAVRHMGAVLTELEESLFPALAEKHTAMPVVPEGARQSTLNINSIHGGQEELPADFTGFPAPVVPDSCRMIIDRRFLIEENLADVKAEFAGMMEKIRARRDDFAYEIRDMHEVQPTMTDRDAPVVTAVERAVKQVFGRDPDFVVSPGTYDQKHIDRIGRLKNCIAYGPGILDLAHQPDEYVEIDAMVESATVMALAMVDLLR